MTLMDQPLRRVFGSGPASGLETCAWLVFQDDFANDDKLAIPCESERPFFSFLAGKRIPYLWRDQFINGSELDRTYFGWQRFLEHDDAEFISQPLPLGGTVEALEFGKAVVDALPGLFARFVEIDNELSISWIMSPLWVAMEGILDDQLALACISLERLAAEFRDYCKRQEFYRSGEGFWEEGQGRNVRSALKNELDRVGQEVGLTDQQMSKLCHSIEQLGQPSNFETLMAVFHHVAIELTAEEKNTINNRNRALHGKRTLKEPEDIHNVDKEMQHFDIIRVLIHRALLGLLQYEGLYVDYASRPVEGNFQIKQLARRES